MTYQEVLVQAREAMAKCKACPVCNGKACGNNIPGPGSKGIGDTAMRVSLTDDPVQEGYAAKDILKAAGLRKEGVNIVSCPTCGRTQIDLIGLVNRVDEALKDCKKPITVAVMGCVVNGPGEAREADIGIAGGDGWGMLFEKGEQVEKLPYDALLPALLKRIESL